MNKKNLSKQWKLIHEILQRNRNQKDPINKLVIHNNVILTECKDICNELNDFFVQPWHQKLLLVELPLKRTFLRLFHHLQNLFFFEPCTEFEVFRELVNLNEKKAIGIENIPIRFLKMTSEITSSLLSNLCNKCILRGSFPNRLKIAKVTPLYKSGPTHKTTNYRPIRSYHLFPKYLKK